ncbi:MAG: 16S rRNA (guanine(527)-N(7))-methyltransferase RsmG [Clostridia bacterium]
MEYIEFKNRLQESFQTQKIDVSEKQCKKFFEYMKLLIEWNEKINLTAIVEPGQVITKHFLDSLTILNYIGTKQQKIIDVGTGAGFPGIPIKIMDDLSEITLIDSLNKRINFLQEVINKNNLKNIRAIHGRAEDFGQDKLYREKYDVCVARAVAPMNILVEYLLPFARVNGICICMKGANIEEELEEAKKAINLLGGKIEKVESFGLSGSEDRRNIIIIRKISKTPKQYPRKAGTAKKYPI